MTAFITFVLSNFTLTFLLLGLLVSGAKLSMGGGRDRPTVIETFLSDYLLWAVGFSFFYNFVMHVFFAEMAASFIGWKNSPFQYEVGYASLGFSLVAIFAHRKSFQVRLAAVLGPAFFLWGAAAGHIYQIVVNHNESPGNAGIILWTDIFIPVLGFILLSLSHAWPKTAQSCEAANS